MSLHVHCFSAFWIEKLGIRLKIILIRTNWWWKSKSFLNMILLVTTKSFEMKDVQHRIIYSYWVSLKPNFLIHEILTLKPPLIKKKDVLLFSVLVMTCAIKDSINLLILLIRFEFCSCLRKKIIKQETLLGTARSRFIGLASNFCVTPAVNY